MRALLLAAILALLAAPTASAGDVLLQDGAWSPQAIGVLDGSGQTEPAAIATDAQRLWTVGTAVPVATGVTHAFVIAQRADGTVDTGFSGDGRLVPDFGNGSQFDVGNDVAVLPDGSAAVLGRTDSGGSDYDDLFLIVLRPDGTVAPGFNGGAPLVLHMPEIQQPRAIAYDPVHDRLVVTGMTSSRPDPDHIDFSTFLAAFSLDGTTQFFETIDRSGSAENIDLGEALRVLADGRIALWIRYQTNIDGIDPRFASAIQIRAANGAAGIDVPLGADTTPGNLVETGGVLVAAGTIGFGNVGTALIARVNTDGSGLTERSYDLFASGPEVLTDIAAVDGALAVGGFWIDPAPGGFPRVPFALRLSADTLGQLEPVFSDFPTGYGPVYVALPPALASGAPSSFIASSRANPSYDGTAQALRLHPGTAADTSPPGSSPDQIVPLHAGASGVYPRFGARLGRRGTLLVRAKCPAGARCRGRLVLFLGKTKLGRLTYSIRAGRTATLRLALEPVARRRLVRRLRHTRTVRLRAAVTAHSVTAQRAVKVRRRK